MGRMMLFLQHGRPQQPAVKVARHLQHVPLAAVVQGEVKVRRLAIALVVGQPLQPNAVGHGPVPQLQRQLPLGTMDQLVGNARLPATFPVVDFRICLTSTRYLLPG